MYPYEDRFKAIRLYLKLGKRLRANIRRLGYPTKNRLIDWYREYVATKGLRFGYRCTRAKLTLGQKNNPPLSTNFEAWLLLCVRVKATGPFRACNVRDMDDELHPGGRVPIVGRAPNVQQPTQTENAAVIELCTRDTSAQETVQTIKVCMSTRYCCKSELLRPEASAFMKRHQKPTV